MKLEKILKSKLLFYVAVVLMIVNVVGYVSVGSMECVVIFAVSTYISNHFTKNRAVDILAGLFIANILFGCGRVKEGFKEDHQKLSEVAASQMTAAKCKKLGKGFKDGKCQGKAAANVQSAKLASAAAAAAKKAKEKK